MEENNVTEEMIENQKKTETEEKTTETSKNNKVDWKKEIIDMGKLLLFWVVVLTIITKFLFNPIQVVGPSMHPTLLDQSKGFSSIITNTVSQPDRYDIVVVEAKDNAKEHWVKRVIGMPNDTIECFDDVVYINGEPIEEDYLNEEYVTEMRELYGYFTSDFDEIVLGEDEYFLMGDNRVHSTDSRVVGPFTRDEFTSIGVFIYWPFSELGFK